MSEEQRPIEEQEKSRLAYVIPWAIMGGVMVLLGLVMEFGPW